MISKLREEFNNQFDSSKYEKFLTDVWSITDNKVDFRICETPFFIDESLKNHLEDACAQIISELQKPDFISYSKDAIPKGLEVPNESDHPVFLQIDFGLTEVDGEIIPQLIELQGFPSLYSFQVYIDQKIREHFHINETLTTFYNGFEFTEYINLFKKVLLKNSDPENVVLLEIDPHRQKTKIDFYLTEKYTGIKSVCIKDLIQNGSKLLYKNNGREIPVERIYNRVIFDELNREERQLNFDIHSDLDVDWIGHPNWFFKISKYTLPYLKNEYSPHSIFLSQYNKEEIDLNEYVLKPLYSFAGSGVIIDVKESDIEKIENPKNYILQKKVNYRPILKTPDGGAKVEVRMMYLWDEEPTLVNNLLRVSKGSMMGVDFNKNKTWIGASTAYHIKD
jgi:hypothetical protein